MATLLKPYPVQAHNVALRGAFAAAIAGAVTLTLPVRLVELVTASIGLSEIIPAFAPPMALSARIGVAVGVALMTAMVVLAVGGDRQQIEKGTGSMAWAQRLGWNQIAKLARGGLSAVPDQGFDAPSRPDNMIDAQDIFARRRADLHPDAPPRAPIIASRDLPQIPVATDHMAARSVDEGLIAAAVPAMPVRNISGTVRARPLPRAPEPISEIQLDALRAALDAKSPTGAERAMPVAEAVPADTPIHASAMPEVVPEGAPAMAVPVAPPVVDARPAVGLNDMLARLEGLFDRKLERHAEAAQQPAAMAAQTSMPSQPEACPATSNADATPLRVAVAAAPVTVQAISNMPGHIVAQNDVLEPDAALRAALGTLKSLSEKARSR